MSSSCQRDCTVFPLQNFISCSWEKLLRSRKCPGNLSGVRKVVMYYSLSAAKPLMGACSNNSILISCGELMCKSIVAHCYLESQRFSTAPSRRFLPLAHPVVCEEQTPAVCFVIHAWLAVSEDWGREEGWATAMSLCKIHWIWFMGKMFLNPGTEGVLVQKMAELSQISLDGTSWMADVLTLPAVLPFQGKEDLLFITV